MGSSQTKISDELACAISDNSTTQFASLVYDFETLNKQLMISSSKCEELGIPTDWDPQILNLVCYLNKIPMLKFILLTYPDIDLNIRDIFGFTPLMLAIRSNSDIAVKLLIDKNADCEIKNSCDFNDTALHYACLEGEMRITKLIASHCKDLNVKNDEGMTPLMYAMQRKHLKIVEMLINLGADLLILDNNDLSAIDWGKRVSIDDSFLEKVSETFSSSEIKQNSHNDTFISFTERSNPLPTPLRPNLLTTALSKLIDSLLTDHISWTS